MKESWLFGRLTLSAIPYNVPILVVTFIVVAIIGLAVLGTITYYRKWGYLWRECVTTTDHKKIGIMYMIAAGIMFLRGFSDAIMMRLQQAIAFGPHHGYLPPEHYDQIFTAHGVIMIFFMAMALVFGIINLVVPLQIGARDVAYPFLNSLSFWLYVVSAGLVMMSLFIGNFARTGWLAYPPLSELAYSPGVGVDYYLWALSISGVGTLLGAINILVTIVKMRCPGMTLMKMPIFTWSVLCAMILTVISFPILNITLFLLFLDRFAGMHFFTSAFGGNAMLYINMIWAWGHPEVYILVLPAFGIYSEIVATFCRKTIFGYSAMVYATMAIALLAFIVWLHHFFTMGAGANVNAFFGIATMIISIPTGVKIFNWLFTMYRGRIYFATPMMWTIAFLITFTIGGMTGVLMAVPPVDFQVHNSLFLIAHFHNTIIGGVVFGLFAGYTYWFPKAFGFKLNERLGKYAFWFWVIGFYVAFMPLYALGMMGMTRRLEHYPASTGWHPYLVVACIGAFLILTGIIFQIIQLFYSIKHRAENPAGNDPWDARTLEWSIPSPPPHYNFAITPVVDARDPFWKAKEHPQASEKPQYEDIHMPKSTSMGFWIAMFAGVFGFAMVWNIIWLCFASAIITLACIIIRAFDFNTDYYVKASEVAETEAKLAGGAK
ncbi:MAG: cytochrome o ubiquinol oxidase subunit I [Gammaproteobacteria bacterium CG11_big_fil_rev_8_21_14_0_20_46_22]|nr:MAG: cytochrome o ubiquinol oxidase subunit I [Gammaproteobacteria bacterium CG12_big_fil_rev_8_21_14_0_65_46_12]PIR10057.1 MAG: cytochrome o ubiquinol oxidase subunit I [Gammaproteobacteria bacterium CG11_big_fil_rev_8_21_14_0_20_46_22]